MDPFRYPHWVSAPDLARACAGWRSMPGPLYRRLGESIGAAIRDGCLPLGVGLPAERVLAAELAVSRRTVIAAYGLLARNGLTEARRGAGHYVRRPSGAAPAPFPVGSSGDATSLDLSFAAPMDAVPEVGEALQELPGRLFLDWHGYAPLGLDALRRAVADRFTTQGAPTSPDQILITSGAQQAIQLFLQTHLRLGVRVLIESPTYPLIIEALRARRAAIISTPVDPAGGWDLSAFEETLRAVRPSLAIMIPDCHMPTGRTMPDADRERLAAAASRTGTTLLVDESVADLQQSQPQRPVAAFAHEGIVTVGSVSKAAWGGLRVGWLRANPSIIQRVAQIRATLDIAGPPIDQHIAVSLLQRWPAIAERRRRQAAAGRTIAQAGLRELLPSWTWHPPDGGLCLWIRLPHPTSTALANLAPAHGLRLMPGPRFSADRDLDHYLRLPHVLPEPDLATAIERLAALNQAVALSPSLANHHPPEGPLPLRSRPR